MGWGGACLALLLALSGCVAIPQPRQADLPLPAAWPGGQARAQIAPDWWTAYGDPALDALMAEALAHNDDVRLAAARIEEARANLGLARSDQYPEVELDAGGKRSRRSTQVAAVAPGSAVSNNWNIGLTAAYEADLWGRYRAASAAARAELLASEYARAVVRQSLTHDLARAYFGLRALEAQARLARDTLANRREAVALYALRVRHGLDPELTQRQAEAEQASVAADLARIEGEIGATGHALALLAGRAPGELTRPGLGQGRPLAELVVPPAVPAGLPADLLQRRPDLRQAEAQLAAADARIAEARAALYPNLTLTAQLGSESRALSDLFSGPATAWGLTAGLAQTVFNAGRTEAALQGRAARREQALIGYEKAVRQAFREVYDALVAHRQAREAAQAEAERAQALARAAVLADLRYKNGLSGYLEVLDARRNLYAAQQAGLAARRDQLIAVASLNKALGGEWKQQ